MSPSRPGFRNILDHVARTRPDIGDAEAEIVGGHILVDGTLITNPRSMVRADAAVVLRRPRALRGEDKLRAALTGFAVDLTGRVCVDLGASAGGFTRVLLAAGAGRVYAVDAGHGQLLGELRNDERVVNLERTNLAGAADVIPSEPAIDVVTMDLSYLSVAAALPQMEGLTFASDAHLIALVKPMFELGLDHPPDDDPSLERARDLAVVAASTGPWRVASTMPSPVTGSRGAREWLLHAIRDSGEGSLPGYQPQGAETAKA